MGKIRKLVVYSLCLVYKEHQTRCKEELEISFFGLFDIHYKFVRRLSLCVCYVLQGSTEGWSSVPHPGGESCQPIY